MKKSDLLLKYESLTPRNRIRAIQHTILVLEKQIAHLQNQAANLQHEVAKGKVVIYELKHGYERDAKES